MKYRQFMMAMLAGVLLLTAAVSPIQAQGEAMSSQDQRFVEGLLKRGLYSLADVYLKQLLERGVEPSMINAQRVVVLESQAMRSGDETVRDAMFGEAAVSYAAAISQLGERVKVTQERAQDQLRFEQFKLRVSYGEMLWQKHANSQLTIMEITDGVRGDREKVQRLLRKAIEVFNEVHADANVWYDEMERHPDMGRRYGELYGQMDIVKAYSLYQIAWASYYLAFALPADHEDRAALLDDAVAKFTVYTKIEGESEARYQSLKGRGMCYRLKGMFAEAEDDLRKAIEVSKDENFKITVYYELAQSHLAAKKYGEAQSTLQELRNQNFESMPGSFIGGQLMPFLDARILLAEGITDSAKRDRAMVILRDLWQKGDFWQLLVSAEVSRHIEKDADPAKLTSLELWVLADMAYGADELERAVELFSKYLQITPQTDPTYQEAQYNIAACYVKLSELASESGEKMALMKKAANAFLAVARTFPESPVADSAAEMYVFFTARLFEMEKTQESTKAYADALKWALDNRANVAAAGDMQFFYAGVLTDMGQHKQASLEFDKVTRDSPNFHMATFLAMDTFRHYLLEQLNKMQEAELKREVDLAISKTEQFVRQVDAMSDGDLKTRLAPDAAKALIIAAEILSTPQVKEYERGRRLIERYEKDYGQYDEFLGEALKIKVDCMVGMGMGDEAMNQLDQIMTKVNDPMPILQNLFRSITKDIERLNHTLQHQAARERLQQANDIADRLKDYLARENRDPEGYRVAAIQYEIAMLHMNAGELEAAVEMLDSLCYRPYQRLDQDDMPRVEVRHLQGLATATQKLAVATRDEPKTYELYKKAAYYWRNIAESMRTAMQSATVNASRETDPRRKAALENTAQELTRTYWEARLNEFQVYFSLNELEKRHGGETPTDYYGIIRRFMAVERSLNSQFGGASFRVRFDRLARDIGM